MNQAYQDALDDMGMCAASFGVDRHIRHQVAEIAAHFDWLYQQGMQPEVMFDDMRQRLGSIPTQDRVLTDLWRYHGAGFHGVMRQGADHELTYHTHNFMNAFLGESEGVGFAEILGRWLHDGREDCGDQLNKTPEEVTRDLHDICHAYPEAVLLVKDLTNPQGVTGEGKREWQRQHLPTMPANHQNAKLGDRLCNNWCTVHNPKQGMTKAKAWADLDFTEELMTLATAPPAYVRCLLGLIELRVAKRFGPRA